MTAETGDNQNTRFQLDAAEHICNEYTLQDLPRLAFEQGRTVRSYPQDMIEKYINPTIIELINTIETEFLVIYESLECLPLGQAIMRALYICIEHTYDKYPETKPIFKLLLENDQTSIGFNLALWTIKNRYLTTEPPYNEPKQFTLKRADAHNAKAVCAGFVDVFRNLGMVIQNELYKIEIREMDVVQFLHEMSCVSPDAIQRHLTKLLSTEKC